MIKLDSIKTISRVQLDASKMPDFKWDIPLVIEHKKITYKLQYCGFIPGLLMQNITSLSLNECQEKLVKYAKEWMAKAKKEKLPVPFFPSNEEIKKDYNPIKIIRYK